MEPADIIENARKRFQEPILEAMSTGLSDIAKFYQNKTIFLTGGSGFIGKQLLEKLFRCCHIKKAYILIRSKRGTNTRDRLQEILDDHVFDEVRKIYPNFNDKVIAIEGDVGELNLGMSDHDTQTIIEQVEIVINLAATIRFDEKMKMATLVNVRGTRETIMLAKSCKNIVCFIHVSTAYSNATSKLIGSEVFEQFYPSPVSPDTLIQMAQELDEDRLDAITPGLIQNWPNTYAFTKAVAEELVRTEAHDLRCVVVRPSIVLHTYREPIPGWLDGSCKFGPSGFVLGALLGFIRVMCVDTSSIIAMVPVDFVNNATIAAGWEVSTKNCLSYNKPIIYNVSSTKAGTTFRHISVPMRTKRVRAIIPDYAVWYCYLIETKNKTVYHILSWLFHKIPAYVIDGAVKLFKIKTRREIKSLVDVYEKYDKITEIYNFFLTNEWDFNDSNLVNLFKNMNETDKQIFNFDVYSINWDDYALYWCLSIRKFILKDDFKHSKNTIRKQFLFKIANYFIVMLYAFIFYKIIIYLSYLFVNIFGK